MRTQYNAALKIGKGSLKRAKILYHITGYKHSSQFEWLFRAIYNDFDLFIIHVDKKSPRKIHREYKSVAGFKDNVIFLPSLAITWGGCGLIDAEALAIKHALENDPSWTHIVNLSAQDYPLKSPNTIREHLARSWPSNYVLCKNIRQAHWRIRKRPRFRYIEWNSRRFFTPIPKMKPRDIDIGWVGPWWHILTREFCSWLMANERAKNYLMFLRSAGMPDEMLIQNIIMDSPFKDKLISCCKHEIIWRRAGEPRASSARPNVLTIHDLPLLEASNAYFARKFDHEVDRQVLEVLANRNDLAVPVIKEQETWLSEPAMGN